MPRACVAPSRSLLSPSLCPSTPSFSLFSLLFLSPFRSFFSYLSSFASVCFLLNPFALLPLSFAFFSLSVAFPFSRCFARFSLVPFSKFSHSLFTSCLSLLAFFSRLLCSLTHFLFFSLSHFLYISSFCIIYTRRYVSRLKITTSESSARV